MGLFVETGSHEIAYYGFINMCSATNLCHNTLARFPDVVLKSRTAFLRVEFLAAGTHRNCVEPCRHIYFSSHDLVIFAFITVLLAEILVDRSISMEKTGQHNRIYILLIVGNLIGD